jgi:imidazolonepropionase-like amidohydrolase
MSNPENVSFRARAGLLALVLALCIAGFAPAEVVVLEGATVHPVVGEPYVGRVVIADGLIQSAGAEAAVPEGARVLDLSGRHVYPGFFDAMSRQGLVEISSVPGTVDTTELGRFNPHLQAATAVHPASEVIPVTRANGITHSLVAPATGRDGVLAGQASLLHMAGWTVEEMLVDAGIAMVLQWPAIRTRELDFSTFEWRDTPFAEAKEEAEAAQNELREWFEAARHYSQAQGSGSERLEVNHKLAALARVLGGDMPLVVQADAKRDIESAVAFAEEQGLRIVLAGGEEAWKVKELLAEKDIPVILGRIQSLPDERDDPYDRPFRTPGELVSAGVKIAFGSSAGGGFGPGGAHSARTLPYEAATAIPYGLNPQDALAALTLWPAEIFGVEESLGSITPGKVANLVVTDGDPLAIPTQVLHLFIRGEEVSTDNRHESLYERYRARPRASAER